MPGKVTLILCALAVASVAALSGCAREEAPSAAKGTFAIIDGKPFTAAELRDAVLVRAKIAELSKRPIKGSQFAVWANGYAMRILPGLIQANVLEHALKARGIAPTAASDATMLANYNRMTRQDARTIDELAALFGEMGPVFRQQVVRESLLNSYFESCAETQASERDVVAYYQNLTNLQSRCRRITEAGWKKGRLAHARLMAGAPWADVARDFSEDGDIEPSNDDNWKEWMTVPLSKIEPSELADAVAKLSVGEFTEPMDIEEGLAIVRLNARDGDNCELSRILMRLGRDVPIPDKATAVREIRKQKWHDVQRRELEMARRNFKVDYLFSTNFSYRIWDSPTRESRPFTNGSR